MRKLILTILTGIGVLTSIGYVQAAETMNDRIPKAAYQEIEVLVNARKVLFPDQKPKMVNDQILVPVRFVSDKLGGTLNLNGKVITIVKGDSTIKLTIGENTATVNGETLALGLAAEVEKGRTYVPLRFISEGLGEKVEWDKLTRFVWIGSKEIPELKDIMELQDIGPYERYFKDKDHLMVNCFEGCKPATSIYKVSADDFPFLVRGEAYYRFDLSYLKNDNRASWIRAVTTDRGGLGRGFIYLHENSIARLKSSGYFTEENVGDFRFRYYAISNPLDPETASYKINQASYIVIRADYPGLIFVENPFK